MSKLVWYIVRQDQNLKGSNTMHLGRHHVEIQLTSTNQLTVTLQVHGRQVAFCGLLPIFKRNCNKTRRSVSAAALHFLPQVQQCIHFNNADTPKTTPFVETFA